VTAIEVDQRSGELNVVNRASLDSTPKTSPTHSAVVTATGSDRYRTALAWAEMEAEFEHKAVLVAFPKPGSRSSAGSPASSSPAICAAGGP
jgi:hypothetical protein